MTLGDRDIIRARDAAEYSPGTRMASSMEARAIEDRHDLLAEVDRLENEVYSWEMNATAAAMGVGRDIERARILELINVLPSTHIEWVAAETGERTVMGDRYVALAAVIAIVKGET